MPKPLASGLSRSRLPALDALRAFSVTMVVLYHAGLEKTPGGLGVLAFFVLSGFLITWLLLIENEHKGTISIRHFYLRRILRISPAFYAYWCLASVGLTLLGKRVVWAQAWAALFYVNNYYQALYGDPNTSLSHTWSLSVEEQFYLFWPVTFLTLRINLDRALRSIAVTILMIWSWRLCLVYFKVPQGYIYEALDTRLDSLLVGCALAVALRSGWGGNSWRNLLRTWMPAGTILLLAASAVMENRIGTPYRDTVGLALNSVLVAILIVQWIAVSPESILWRWLNQKWLVSLGTISYSIYLYQQLVVDVVGKRLVALPLALRVPTIFAAVIGAASVSYFVIEKPFLRLKKAFAFSPSGELHHKR